MSELLPQAGKFSPAVSSREAQELLSVAFGTLDIGGTGTILPSDLRARPAGTAKGAPLFHRAGGCWRLLAQRCLHGPRPPRLAGF